MLSMGLLPAARACRRCRTDSEKPACVLDAVQHDFKNPWHEALAAYPGGAAGDPAGAHGGGAAGGPHLGAPDPAVVLRFRDRMALVALASGDIGHVGAAIVEGRVALEGGMRDLMAAATGLLTRDPARDQHHG